MITFLIVCTAIIITTLVVGLAILSTPSLPKNGDVKKSKYR